MNAKSKKLALEKIKQADDLLGEAKQLIGLPNDPQLRIANKDICDIQLRLDDVTTRIVTASM